MTIEPSTPPGYSTSAYLDLVAVGVIGEDDSVELLDGMIVSAPPQGPLHSAVLMAAGEAVRSAVGGRGALRVQMPLVAGPRSVPEPDLAVVTGGPVDYLRNHPDHALLVVEIADSSLPFERLTKSRVYAGAGVPEYWIVNLRDRRLEIFTQPDVEGRVYRSTRTAAPGERVQLLALEDAFVEVASLFPGY